MCVVQGRRGRWCANLVVPPPSSFACDHPCCQTQPAPKRVRPSPSAAAAKTAVKAEPTTTAAAVKTEPVAGGHMCVRISASLFSRPPDVWFRPSLSKPQDRLAAFGAAGSPQQTARCVSQSRVRKLRTVRAAHLVHRKNSQNTRAQCQTDTHSSS